MVALASSENDPGVTGDEAILREAYDNFKAAEDWVGDQDQRSREDIKFANADDRNQWQWPSKIFQERTGGGEDGVALTINSVRIHNDLIINSMCKNNYGIRVRPTGGKATYQSAKMMQSCIRRIEDISKFSTHRRTITEHQVDGGVGYCLIETRYVSHRSFNQEIYLTAARDATAVRLDPWIKEPDGSDANFGFWFDRMSRRNFERRYPKWKDKVGTAPIQSDFTSQWLTDKDITVAKYYRKKERPDMLVSYKLAEGDEIEKLKSEIIEESGQEIYDQLFDDIEEGRIDGKARSVINHDVEWFLIAGDTIIDRGEWAGKYIPIARCVGREVVIEGQLDRKGMTRQLISGQRMLNFSASMAVEDVALQPRPVFMAPARSIEGQEQFKDMNVKGYPVILFNDIDDEAPDGLQKVDAPQRLERPQPAQGHLTNMQFADKWIMSASGQFQAQMGENDTQSAASGKAIGERQQQADTATFHFNEHQTDMLRHIGVQLLDLIPKIYDNERTIHVRDDKNEKHWIRIDPKLSVPLQEIPHDKEDEEAVKMAFNPAVGEYECVSDPGPDYATQRQEAWSAISLIMQSNKEIAACCADLLFKYGDFPGADELMGRLQKEIKATKPYLFGDDANPQLQLLQQQNARLTALATELQTKLADANLKIRGRDERRDIEAYNADTKRMEARINALAKVMLTPQQKAQMEHELEIGDRQHVYSMIQQANQGDVSGQSDDDSSSSSNRGDRGNGFDPASIGAKLAPDGRHYLPDPRRPGKYLMVMH